MVVSSAFALSFVSKAPGPTAQPETKAEMKRVLEEIQSGEFARKWISENRAGAPFFKATRRRERDHGVEKVGKGLRRMMNWIDEKEV